MTDRPLTRGEKVCAFIERFCRVPEGAMVGAPMVLEPFQRRFVLDVYDNPAGTRRGILSIARKNGKSGLIAGLLLAHIVGPEAKLNSQIVSGAMSRDQAALVFALACKMVQLSPRLSELVKIVPSGKRLIGLPMNVEFKALAADGKTAHGLSPVLAILDEIGQVEGPQSDFVDAITTSQGAHDAPLLLAISTQAASDSDLLSVWIDDAKRSKDPRIVCHVYSAPEGCDLMDESAWRAANPALGVFRSLDDLREQMAQAVRMPSMEASARNLLLNQRVATNAPFVSPSVWKACGGEVLPRVPTDVPIFAGLDLSKRTDLTALVLVGRVDDVWQVWPFFWTPAEGLAERARRDRAPYVEWHRAGLLRTTPGATVDYGHVAEEMAEIFEGLELQGVAFDRWRMDVMLKELAALEVNLPMLPWGQGFKDMAPALDYLEGELLNKRVAHGMHPVLTMCAANATTVQDSAGNRKLDKSKATGRIDGLQALSMAMGLAARMEAEEKYQSIDYA